MRRWTLVASAWAAALGLALAQSRVWTVRNTRPATVNGAQFSEEPVIPCRRVAFRTKASALDTWGPVRIYPVVRSPKGQLYRGFLRRYAAKSIADRWLFWTFPTGFRSPDAHAETEAASSYGDSLADALDTDAAKRLPPGDYEVKWVINDRLVDTGDHFDYEYRTISGR